MAAFFMPTRKVSTSIGIHAGRFPKRLRKDYPLALSAQVDVNFRVSSSSQFPLYLEMKAACLHSRQKYNALSRQTA